MKNKNKIKYFVKIGISVVIFIVLITTSFSSATTHYSTSKVKLHLNENNIVNVCSSKMLTYKFDFTEPELQQTTLQGTCYTRVVVHGCLNIGAVGEPALPVKIVRLVLPTKTAVKDIIVTGESHEIDMNQQEVNLKEHPIIPEQPSRYIEDGDMPELVQNREIYASSKLYPGNTHLNAGVGDCCGYQILTLYLFPVQYIPASGRIIYYPRLSISLKTEQTEKMGVLYRGLSHDMEKVKAFVDNPEVLDTYDLTTRGAPICGNGLCSPSESYDYILITNDDLADTTGYEYNWTDLLNHRRAFSGLSTKKITVETIDGCPSYWNDTDVFNDSAAHIREFIKDAYQNWNTQYVLLGGDWDAEDTSRQIVPVRIFAIFEMPLVPGPLSYAFIPCDLYYSNLNGTWYWGPYENVWGTWDIWGGGKTSSVNDYFAEVSVSRLTVDNASQISNIVEKIIWYDTVADSDFLKKAVFFGGDLGWPEVTSAEYMEEIRIGNDPYFYECEGFVEWNEDNPSFQFDVSTRIYYDHGATVPDDYKPVINNNNACIINHLSHGNPWKSFDMVINGLKNLSNSKYFFGYSQQCNSGRFIEGNTSEKILMCDSRDNGAFALVFNTGYGVAAPSTNGASQFLQRHFWHYLFDVKEQDLSQWILSDAHRYSKDQISAYICHPDWNYGWAYAFYSAHLFGDPAQTFRLTSPGDNIGIESLEVPSPVKSKDITYVNTTVINSGQYDETDIIVSLRCNGVEVNTTTIPFLERLATEHVNFQWTPNVGVYNVTVNVTIPGIIEEDYEDNERTVNVIVGVQNEDTGELFDTIQESLDDSHTLAGHVILVPKGIFHEYVNVTKNIVLMGIHKRSTIIEGVGLSESVIQLQNVSLVNITGFIIRNGGTGICIKSSDYVTIFNNDIRENIRGIHITDETRNSTVTWNTILDNIQGVVIDEESNSNLIYLNSFENTQNALDFCDTNQWDNGYLDGFCSCGGNWWSDYLGDDTYSGSNQDEPGSDGIGDTPYMLADGTHLDHYPFIQLFDPAHPVENLDSGERFSSIQEAIDDLDTHNGHTIKVWRNIYYENLVFTKSLTLIGVETNTTILDGNGGDQDIIQIAELVDGVKISNFTIRNSTGHGININSDDACISNNTIYNTHTGIFIEPYYCDSLRNTTITHNIIRNNNRGITLHGSHGNTIYENTITENSIGIFCNRVGLFWGVSNNKIMNNTISYNIYGIRFYDLGFEPSVDYVKSIGNSIIHNTICNNEQVGIFLWLGNKNHIESNMICENNEGVYLELSSNNTISSNIIVDNNEYGISLYQKSNKNKLLENTILNTNGNGIELNDRCRQNHIIENIIANNNGTGLELLDSCRGNKILKNTIDTNAGYGIRAENAADNNKIYYNNFFGNLGGNAWDICLNTWYNVEFEEGNYWDDFQDNPGYPEVYEIPPNGTNVDLYPLSEPWTPPVPGDTDHDGDVDLSDLAQLLGYYGTESGATWEMGDFDGDGDVDLSDLAELIGNYGYGVGPIPGDTDLDGDVDLSDLAQLLGYYGTDSGATWEMGDFDGDGDVDLSDLAELIGNYGYGT